MRLPDHVEVGFASSALSQALGRGGDYGDIYFESSDAVAYAMRNAKVSRVTRSAVAGVGVRVLSGAATGYAYAECLEPDCVNQAARMAGSIISLQPEDPKSSRRASVSPRHETSSSSLANESGSSEMAGGDAVRLLTRVSTAAQRFDSRIVSVEVKFGQSRRDLFIATSEGRVRRSIRRSAVLSVGVVAESGGKRQKVSISHAIAEADSALAWGSAPEDCGRSASAKALELLDAVDAPAGSMDVVLGPGTSGVLLHEAVGHGLEADFILHGTSRYAGRVGDQVGTPACSVVDDGSMAEGLGSIDFDDEGGPPGRHLLIEKGRLVGLLHDRRSARALGVEQFGNARRQDYRFSPMPRMTNTVLLPGNDCPDEIVRSVSFGIYAKRFSGGEVNISNGDFVFHAVDAYLIENGRITAPLVGVTLIGNGPEVLKHVTMVGPDLALSTEPFACMKEGQALPVGVGMPTVKVVDGLTVGGTRRLDGE